MIDIYDALNISNIPLEKRIELSISQTRNVLKGINTKGACATYSRHLFSYLQQNHVMSKVVNTKDLGAEYEHFFVIVPINSLEYYLVDLTYQQFENDKVFKELYDKGHEKVTDLNFYLYYAVVTGEMSNVSIKDVFLQKGRLR